LSATFRANARAKINLSLHVVGRRGDGFHDLSSLVAFARIGDRLHFRPGGDGFSLTVSGPGAKSAGPNDDNLVLRAARLLASKTQRAMGGRFALTKRLPVAAGLGGGSADAACALRLLCEAYGLDLHDPAVTEAARACGSDVPVCLEGVPRIMEGTGHQLGPALPLPSFPALLVNPGFPLATPPVFAALGLEAGQSFKGALPPLVMPEGRLPERRLALAALLHQQRNDLVAPAATIAPKINAVQERLDALGDVMLARMSGSGATFFALFPTQKSAQRAAQTLRAEQPDWWIVSTLIEGGPL